MFGPNSSIIGLLQVHSSRILGEQNNSIKKAFKMFNVIVIISHDLPRRKIKTLMLL